MKSFLREYDLLNEKIASLDQKIEEYGENDEFDKAMEAEED